MRTPPPDKVLHFAAGTIAASAGMVAALLLQMMGWALLPAVGAAAACATAALAREVYNRHQGGAFDWQDIAATCAGGLPVVLVAAMGQA